MNLSEEIKIFKRQYRHVLSTCEGDVECTCGKLIKIHAAYRCLYCGIWFCRSCGKEHFGPKSNP